MDIKEIAEQVSKRIYVEDGLLLSKFISEKFSEALISAYKAELLKEVGGPVNACPVGVALNAVSHVGAANYDHREREARRWIYEAEKQLFTSDKVAAAILKATKPMEDQLAAAQEEIEASSKDSLRLLESVKYLRGIAEHGEERQQREDETVEQFVLGYVKKLEDQLAKAEQLWQVAQGRCDGLEEKLAKAEQRVAEWQPIETAPKDGTLFLGWVGGERWSSIDGGGSGYAHDVSQADFCWWRADFNCPGEGYFDNSSGQIGDSQGVTHWMPLPKAPSGASS